MIKQTNFNIQTGLSENKIHCFLALCFFFASCNLIAKEDEQTRKPSPLNCCLPSEDATAGSATSVIDVPNGGTGRTTFVINEVILSGTTPTGAFNQVTNTAGLLALVSTGATTAPAFSVLTVPGGGSGVATFAGFNQLIASGTTATSAEQQVIGSATALPLVSQGAAVLPAYALLSVVGGGTGVASFAALNSIILSGTTTTSAMQQVAGGASGTILTSAGAATAPTFQALTANVRVFTTAGGLATYTPTAGTKYILVEAIGGGGGSGSVAGTAFHASAGAGSGSYSRLMLTAAQIGASVGYTVGAGGAGGASGAANTGFTGTATSFGALLTAPAGLLSAAGGAGAQTGGAGGALGTGGMIAGFAGQSSIAGAVGTPVGAGGDAPLGFGYGGYPTVMLTSALAGQGGTGFGSGASGASAGQAGTTGAGGAGAGGAIIITEYILA